MRKLRLAIVVPMLAAALVATTAPATTAPAAAAPDRTDEPHRVDVPARYTEQALDWHPCSEDELPSEPPPGAEDIECATYLTPRDWNNPDEGADLTIAVSRLKASEGPAQASVLTNPGGPGAPGRGFPAKLRNQERLRAHQEVIGFDPRGTGKSTNIT